MQNVDDQKLLYRYIIIRLNRQISDGPHGLASRIARELGVSAPHLYHARTGKDVLGQGPIGKLMAYWGISRRDLLREAKAHFAAWETSDAPTRTPEEDRYPNRARALRQLACEIPLPPGLRDHVDSIVLANDTDLPFHKWFNAIVSLVPFFENGPPDFRTGDGRGGS